MHLRRGCESSFERRHRVGYHQLEQSLYGPWSRSRQRLAIVIEVTIRSTAQLVVRSF